MAGYRASFDPTDGTGNWAITIPTGADKHDVLALGPVIDGIKDFLAPTVATDEPVQYQLVEAIEPPDRDTRAASGRPATSHPEDGDLTA